MNRSIPFVTHFQLWLLCAPISLFVLSSSMGFGQGPREGRERPRAHVYQERVIPHWYDEGKKFWYEVERPGKQKEFASVDLLTGQTLQPFDPSNAKPDAIEGDANWTPSRTGADSEIVFQNQWNQSVEIFWIEGSNRRSYGKIGPGEKRAQHTFGGHRWQIADEEGKSLGVVIANDSSRTHVIDGTRTRDESRPERARRRPRPVSDKSPNGDWTLEIVEGNLVLRSDKGMKTSLTQDGSAEKPYGNYSWSPDSKKLVAFQTTMVEPQKVFLVESSPKGQGRALLRSNPYSLPGDPFPRSELVVFDLETMVATKPTVDAFENEWERPNVHWLKDSSRFLYSMIDRGHQRFRLVSIQADGKEFHNVIDEKSKTFIWTVHTENHNIPIIQWLEGSDECIYASEETGWRHLSLVDATTDRVTPITQVEPTSQKSYVVRQIDRIDEEKRQLWFRASGFFEGQDPYLLHFAKVNFDGTGLVWLTQEDGTHSVQYSIRGDYLIDSYSRVDMPPKHEVRRVVDGSLVCKLQSAEVDKEWNSPEVFHAKGRDGKTDIWGIICRPKDFDANKKYPVIEDIYAGPQSSYVPKNFSVADRYASLTDLGFIVVKIDGMGTANRSKAFHDVCWHNLKDAGFEDRIRWIREAGAKNPEMDLTRVGIYGTSAGGQNAAGAVLFHPEFYKAAVAACGCHDNRMDKASWNEQWMGYPVGPHYAESSNIDNAHRLGGKLLLIVGELDDNVPPESTLRFVDALVRADKDFELLVVPNAGHGMGGAYGVRRMHDFFVRTLGKP